VKLLFAVTLSIVLSAAATPALAEPMEQGTFEQHFNFVREGFCGDMDISIETTAAAPSRVTPVRAACRASPPRTTAAPPGQTLPADSRSPSSGTTQART
jgi:hypothetical protein